jgi:hydrogenase 3 maturation protease
MKNILLGIGNRLRSDDGAGSYTAGRFSRDGWLSIDGADIPENYTGIIKKERPALLVIVDACDLGEPAGTLRRVPLYLLSQDSGFNTHSAPLAMLIDYLKPHTGEILFIGIQPGSTGFGEELSEAVTTGVELLIKYLHSGEIMKIPSAAGS